MKNVIIGTAGHIDHGKTTLIKALTGKDTDRLKEEKKRGISIDLGFAYFDLPSGKRAGIIDVPGHEKFIKNMLAGVSGMDVVLFVVAADEGVMPQTIEHLDILNFIEINNGIIVITKCDLVDDDFLMLVKEDIKEKVKGTFLEDAKIIEVDSVSKRGIDELIYNIDILTENVEEKNLNSYPRMHIDRVFTMKGFGTVVTGTLIEGKINLDDEVVIYPKDIKTKIRGIQVHGKAVKTAYAGQRSAINLSNVKVEELERGDILAYPNCMQESMMIDVKVKLTRYSNVNVNYWDRVRLYHGTREILARIVPLDREELTCEQEGYCQLRLDDTIVAKKGDRFVIRSYSPMKTIGGGIILDPNPKKHKRFDKKVIDSLKLKEKGDLKEIINQTIKRYSKEYPDIKTILKYTGENEEVVNENILQLMKDKTILCINKIYIHKEHYEMLKEKTIKLLNSFHKEYPLKEGIIKEELRSKVEASLKTKDFDALLELFLEDKLINIKNNLVSTWGFEVKFTNEDIKIKKEIEQKLLSDGFTPRNIKDITLNNPRYEQVLQALDNNTVVILDDNLAYHKKYYDKALNLLKDHINKNGHITLSEFKELMGVSRKYSIALLEYFDKIKITKRIEDKRVLS
ncbi:selenocysteine-specific elongation factor [Alkalithermobacter thermoalcaliphilus JW-YL-7 = DSM 7308]|uniref:Selenocysteine-specific elongation factor n=1 Tax=Alkalithermobacter thermoalcaliphilus JW-YL-7 = DSM 7308 TaxID=1121328 RepID=A0A150FR75_CLOPD|nr:selenocysteine-specific translation elongation factor [[Clostridium] paradoxum JW-YL-7 = DSM 7308]SHL02228.1 selenocysteine-specific elongation factor [[Clostridium] paradoxum JW-YL-7 = DSM 7308]